MQCNSGGNPNTALFYNYCGKQKQLQTCVQPDAVTQAYINASSKTTNTISKDTNFGKKSLHKSCGIKEYEAITYTSASRIFNLHSIAIWELVIIW